MKERTVKTLIPRRAQATAATLLLVGIGVLAGSPGAAIAGAAADTVPPDVLNQRIAPDQPIVTEPAVLSAGHVDIGPRFIDGEWTLLIHDDAARADPGAPSVWRYPDQTVLRVTDASQLTVPDDPAYEFLGAPAGSPVHVVPQTQNPDVVWVGWNTQDPDVMQTIDRGVTLSLSHVDGPGDLIAYLQSGNFGAPTPLWDSRQPELQPVWVDVNTHTHANWVFTEPGVYLATFEIAADLIDGSTVSDTQSIRFAVGDATSDEEALSAVPLAAAPEAPSESTEEGADDTEAASATAADPLVPILIGAIVVVALLLVGGVVLVVVRGGSAKKRALDARSQV
jgi:surface-anchored protein